jgi:CTP synthase
MDASSIYEVPLAYHREGLDAEVLACFGIADAPAPDLSRWETIHQRMVSPTATSRSRWWASTRG